VSDHLPAKSQELFAALNASLLRRWRDCALGIQATRYTISIPDIIDYEFAFSLFREIRSSFDEGVIPDKFSPIQILTLSLWNIAALYRINNDPKDEGLLDGELFAAIIINALDVGQWSAVSRTVNHPDMINIIIDHFSMNKIRRAPANRIAPWLAAFRPVAVAFCAEKQTVSYGQLRRKAREWSEQLKDTNKGWILPADDKSLNSGIKKLVSLGYLSIPGKEA
jgi:hypothetical protein